jgi:hypothetical protein
MKGGVCQAMSRVFQQLFARIHARLSTPNAEPVLRFHWQQGHRSRMHARISIKTCFLRLPPTQLFRRRRFLSLTSSTIIINIFSKNGFLLPVLLQPL